MKIKIYYTIIFFLFCLVRFTTVFGQKMSDSKEITKAYKINPSIGIEVQNKYGKIQIIPYDKDSAIFKISISAKAETREKLSQLINNVDFDVTKTSFFIGIKTIIGTNRKGILSDLKLFKENFISEDNKISINYTIYVPKYVNMSIYNKYGDVYADDINGTFDLHLANGDFKAGSLSGVNDLDIKFSNNVDIKKISTGRINISYSELRIKNAKNLTISSKSSSMVIDKVNMLKIHSRSDKYYVTQVHNFYGDTYFTDLNLSNLRKELSITTKYGNLNIDEISKTFSFINVNSKITDMNLFFQNGSTYSIDISHKENILNYPTGISKLNKQTLDGEGNHFLTYGTIGGGTVQSKVKIEGERSRINIMHK